MVRSNTTSNPSYRTVSFETESADRTAARVRYPIAQPRVPKFQYLWDLYHHVADRFRDDRNRSVQANVLTETYAYLAKCMAYDRRLSSATRRRMRTLATHALEQYRKGWTVDFEDQRRERDRMRMFPGDYFHDETRHYLSPTQERFVRTSDDELKRRARRRAWVPWNLCDHGPGFFLSVLESELGPYRTQIVAALASTPLPNNVRRIVYRQLPNFQRVRPSRSSPRT